MKYIAVEYFTDLQDNEYAYKAGDVYPRKGYTPSPERIEELSTDKNVRKRPVIAVDEPEAIASAEETVEQAEEKSHKRKRKS